ncbi:MAG: glycosyltransferase family 2 protein [Pseudomonadota bacterium]
MIGLLSLVVTLAAIIAAGLALYLLLEVIVGLAVRRRPPEGEALGPVTVVVPAHDEAGSIAETVSNISGQLGTDDRILVVADNCADGTAEAAREAGAEVIERNDPARRGKGYALQFALDHLRDAPPSAVAFVDADCRLESGALTALKKASAGYGRPVQALYLMDPPANPNARQALAAFAWTFMNRTRMRGLNAIGGLTRVTGSGVLIPWATAADLDLAGGDIVEDLAMTIALAKKSEGPRLVEAAVVRSVFPMDADAAVNQHARWEHGSLRTLRKAALPLLLNGAAMQDRQETFLGLNIAIPPLTLFAGLLIGTYLLAGLFALLGQGAAYGFALFALQAFLVAVVVGWVADGRKVAPLSSFKELPDYVLEKLKVYGGAARRSTQTWTRTGRDADPEAKA